VQQPTHLSGFVQPCRVAKREVVRPEHPDAFVHRSRRTPSTCRPNDQLVGRRSCMSAGKLSRSGFGASHERLKQRMIKRGFRASKIVEDLRLGPLQDREPHSCRLSKRRDRPRLQPAPRPTRYAEKIDPALTREERSGRGFRRNELEVKQARHNEPVRQKIADR
jgi:hypothetical protein